MSTWAALLGLGADTLLNYFGAQAAGDASAAAAGAQLAATKLGIDEQRRQFDTMVGTLSPYTQSGVSALNQQMALLGMAPPQVIQETTAPTEDIWRGIPGTGMPEWLRPGVTGGIPRSDAMQNMSDVWGDLMGQQPTKTAPGSDVWRGIPGGTSPGGTLPGGTIGIPSNETWQNFRGPIGIPSNEEQYQTMLQPSLGTTKMGTTLPATQQNMIAPQSWLSDVKDSIIEDARDPIGAITDEWDRWTDNITAPWTGKDFSLPGGISIGQPPVLGDVGEWLGDTGGKAVDWIGDTGTKIGDWVGDTADKSYDWINEMGAGLGEAIGGLLQMPGGGSAGMNLQDMLGVLGEAPGATIDRVVNPYEGMTGAESQAQAIQGIADSPLLAELTRQGEQAMLQNAAATGGLRGGNLQGALAQFRPAMLQAELDKQYNRLAGLSSMGQSSAAGVGAGAQQTGSNIANLLGSAGAASAGGIMGSGQAWQDFLGGTGDRIGWFGSNQGWW